MAKKVDPDVQAIADYILEQIDFEIDEDDVSMSKLINMKLIDASAKIMSAQKAEEQAKEFGRLANIVESIERNQLVEANSLMRQALMLIASIVPDDNKADILNIAKQMAGRDVEINTGTKIDSVNQSASGSSIIDQSEGKTHG